MMVTRKTRHQTLQVPAQGRILQFVMRCQDQNDCVFLRKDASFRSFIRRGRSTISDKCFLKLDIQGQNLGYVLGALFRTKLESPIS